MAQERLPGGENLLVNRIMSAAKSGDLDVFNQLIGIQREPKWNQRELKQLFDCVDDSGNTVFHYLLMPHEGWFRSRKRRQAKALMCHQLLALAIEHSCGNSLNIANHRDSTPFHLAIKLGYGDVVVKMLEAGADITKSALGNVSTLELAAESKQNGIYKTLLKEHRSLNKNAKEGAGYTCEQIDQAQKVYQRKLKSKQIMMGIFGSIMAIACPVGSILAFYELPFLAVMFSVLIPGVAPFIGLAGAVVLGGILFWSMYHKSSIKYGHHAQELVAIDAANAKLDRLGVELRNIDNQLKSGKKLSPLAQHDLKFQRGAVIQKMDKIYARVEAVQPRVEAQNSDWATSRDVVRTNMLALGSFLCAFSGLLGILEGASTLLPAVAIGSTLLAGIPVVGWCALALAVVVAVGVGVWAYHAKYKPALEQSGEVKCQMHAAKRSLYERKEHYESYEREFVPVQEEVQKKKTPPPARINNPYPVNGPSFHPERSSSDLVGKLGLHKAPRKASSQRCAPSQNGQHFKYSYLRGESHQFE